MRGSLALLVCAALAVLLVPSLVAAQFDGLPQPPVGAFPQAMVEDAPRQAAAWSPQPTPPVRSQQPYFVPQPPVRSMPAAPAYDPYTDFYLTYHQAAYQAARAEQSPTSITPNRLAPSVQPQSPAHGLQGAYSPAQLSGASMSSMQGQLPYAPTVLAEKPFSDYQPPPAVSPYMNLFRINSGFGTAGDYYLFVRPMFEQQAFNRQSLGQIRDLQSAGQTTQNNLEQLDRRTAPLQNPAGFNYFMDLNRYYPGLSR